VNEAVTILSTNGAASTLIEDPSGSFTAGVLIESPAVFGRKSKGFTITGSNTGVLTTASAGGTLVAGNVATATIEGFHSLAPESRHEDNRAQGNSTGIFIESTRQLVRRNAAVGNLGDGIHVRGSMHMVSGTTGAAST